MKKIFAIILGLGFGVVAMAQDEAPAKEAPKQKFTRATFNSTRIINMQSVELNSPGSIQFMISHHFSPLWPEGGSTQDNLAGLLGLNSGLAYTYLSFDYSPTKWMSVGVAAAGRNKYEGFAKFKLLRQQTGAKNIPVTVGYYALFNANAAKDASISLGWNKYSFLHQLQIARKFNDRLSLQLMPTLVYFNVVPYGVNNSNFVGSLGLGGKYKVGDHNNITFEYARQLNMFENLIDKNGNIVNYKPDLLSIGYEINTGGHQFQFYLGNTSFSSAIDQLARNTTSMKLGNMSLGFTLNRSLNLKK